LGGRGSATLRGLDASADTGGMSARAFFALGVALAALVVGWRVFLPASNEASDAVVQDVATLLDAVTQAQFTGAQATLETQRRMTGSYAGAPLAPPVRLVRADAASYCLELARGDAVAYLAGPGGSPQAGRCG
jgi:hypothetical protein